MTRLQKILLGLLILLIGVAFTFYQTRWRDAAGAHLCVDWYRSAHTAAETSLVDGKRPPIERGRGEYTAPILTCGELRRLGQVR